MRLGERPTIDLFGEGYVAIGDGKYMDETICRGCTDLLKTVPLLVREHVISGKWVFHFWDTHGLPPEALVQRLEELEKDGCLFNQSK